MAVQDFEAIFSQNFKGKRVLVTGANGFVASYLIPKLELYGAHVLGTGRQEEAVQKETPYKACDLRDLLAVRDLIFEFKPEYVFHLASQSSVGTSWNSEWQTIEANVQTAHNLMKSLEQLQNKVKIILASSGEVYGPLQNKPAKVSEALKPVSPYAVSKAMMEVLLFRFMNSNIEFIIARAFSHTGAGRPSRFFEASIAHQIFQAVQLGKKEVHLHVGNLDVVRDYSDVREVVEKYMWLIINGEHSKAYNVCSGLGVKLSDVIDILKTEAQVATKIQIDPQRLRRNDLPYLVGENTLKEIFPVERFPLHKTLAKLLSSLK